VNREPFLEVVREALDSLPWKFRRHIENFAVVVEDYPPEGYHTKGLLMGIFQGTPRTAESFFGLPAD